MTMCRGEGGERRHNCRIQMTIIVNAEKGENRGWIIWMDEGDHDLNGLPITHSMIRENRIRSIYSIFLHNGIVEKHKLSKFCE